jgi:hypothetical protein
MLYYICGNCRIYLFKENEEQKECPDHPGGPIEWVYVEDKTIEEEDNNAI